MRETRRIALSRVTGRSRSVRHRVRRCPAARRRQVELERVLGTPALFATAYGNVGSSIYYALGLTAVYALGLTPLVFVVAGRHLRRHRGHLRRGHGALSRRPAARRASRGTRSTSSSPSAAAWAQMLVYVVTVATSAFFVPHYLSIFWEPLHDEPVGHRRRRVVIVVLVVLNIVGVQEAAQALDHARGDRLRDAGAARRARLRARLQPRDPRRQRPLGRRADVVEPRDRGAGGDARLHGRGDRLQPRRGGARPGQERAERVQARGARGLRDLLHAAAGRALGAAGDRDRRRADDAAGAAAGGGRLRERPDPRRRPEPRPRGRAARRARDLRRRPRRHDPLHRHERGRDRRLADHLLDGDLPPDPRGLPAAAPALQDAVALDRRSSPGSRRSP